MRSNILSLVFILSPVIALIHLNVHSQQNQPDANVSWPDSLIVELTGLDSTEKPLVLVLIQPGTFTMGSDRIPANPSNAPWPSHQVTLTQPFYISQCEITQAQYEALRGHESNHSMHKGPDLPVEKVSWYDTQLFIRKLNLLDQGFFRLPTEAEWEYTCRKSSEFKVKGMERGLAEWCEDKWQKPYPRPPQTDPRNKGTLFQLIWPFTNRVFRGFSNGNNQNSAPYIRGFEQSLDYHYSIGFRIVRVTD